MQAWPDIHAYPSWKLSTRQAIAVASTQAELIMPWVDKSFGPEIADIDELEDSEGYSQLDSKLGQALMAIAKPDFRRDLIQIQKICTDPLRPALDLYL